MIGCPLRDLSTSYDVVVIGSGAAGLVAAVRAADGGRRVLVLEKASKFGGTTALSGGVMWAPCNHLMNEAGFADSDDAALAYLNAAAGPRMSEAEMRWYVGTAPRAVRYLVDKTRVSFTPLARPDYHLDWPGAAEGRGLDNDPFDPAVIPGLAEAIRPPSYFPPISMNERDALRGAPVDERMLRERRQAGIRTMGGALVATLLASAIDRGIDLARDARVTALERDESGGWRLTVNDAGNDREASVAATNVVVASGGFEWSRHLREALLPMPITPISAPSNEGDGLMLALGAGADMAEMTAIWGVPVIAAPTQRYDDQPSGRMANVEMTLPGSITVNARGRRFVNEALNYHDLTRVFANVDPGTSRQQNNPAWLVFDSGYLQRYSVAGSTPGIAEEWMLRADSLGALAELCGIDRADLEATVATFNADATTGHDSAFGRGDAPEDRHLGDPNNLPNPCLAPLSTAPFYAVEIHAGVLGTAGGIQVDAHGRMLGRDGHAIEGLFAAGNCSATVFRGAYPGGGATLGSAITRAFAVGEYLSEHLGEYRADEAETPQKERMR